MTYCGLNLNDNPNPPIQLESQLKEIKKILLNKGLNPNDILPRNVCIQKGIIKLIDFGLANISYKSTLESHKKLRHLFNRY